MCHFIYVQNELADEKILKRTFTAISKTKHELCLHSKELLALYLAFNSTTDSQILIDHYKCIINLLKHSKR